MDLTYEEILQVPMGDNDAGAACIGDYLRRLLREVWNEGEGFSGKRPFGNSGWESEMFTALMDAGVIDGAREPGENWVDWLDEKTGYRIINDMIDFVFDLALGRV